MTLLGTGTHVLVFPFPAQGHMIPLLDFTHKLALQGLTITILVTPRNLPLLNPLLSTHPSIKTLILPFPPHPSIPPGIENAKDMSTNSFVPLKHALSQLREPLLTWFRSHPSPPVAIISDIFFGWTHHLACQLSIRRICFSPSGVMAVSAIFCLWRDMVKNDDPGNQNTVVSFPRIPNCPKYPWWQLSQIYRSYVEADPVSEFIRDGYYANMASWGLVFNSFSELESVYLDYLKNEMGHNRVWAVGPVLPISDNLSRPIERGGSSSVSHDHVASWLDTCDDETVVYVCFGSQAVLTNDQMERVASGLEQSGAHFMWSVKEPTKFHVADKYGKVPSRFEDRVAGRGRVIKGWVPQVSILSHRAIGSFLTHCGWNSILEGLMAGVTMLTWPMGADQFLNATLLVDELKVAKRVCEGSGNLPDSDELARLIAESVSEKGSIERKRRAMELSKAALEAVKEGGSSARDLDELVNLLAALE
uniref:Flavonoid 3,7-O-glycosyltransferase n=1 Tax=Tripterygium wilfordii TaxID=458696 RepID=A0A5J6CDX8_TRIWF|nr:flavonoid 3,7-O-glycosyltransferase [Tripterygium wilfordii]